MSTVTKVTGLVLSAGQLPLEGVPEKGTRQETSRGTQAVSVYVYVYVNVNVNVKIDMYTYIYIHM